MESKATFIKKVSQTETLYPSFYPQYNITILFIKLIFIIFYIEFYFSICYHRIIIEIYTGELLLRLNFF